MYLKKDARICEYMSEEDMKLCREVLTFHRLREQKPKIWNAVLKKTCEKLPKSDYITIAEDLDKNEMRKEKPNRKFILILDAIENKFGKKSK